MMNLQTDGIHSLHAGFGLIIVPPGPCITEPKLLKKSQSTRLGPMIDNRCFNQSIIRPGSSIFDKNVKVSILFEDPGIHQLILGAFFAGSIAIHELLIGESSLRIFIKHLEVIMRWSGIKVIIHLFDIFTVIAFDTSQAKHALFEYWILVIPQTNPQTQRLSIITETSDSILTPSVGPTARQVMAEVVPCFSCGAIILSHSAPLTLTQVRAPFFP